MMVAFTIFITLLILLVVDKVWQVWHKYSHKEVKIEMNIQLTDSQKVSYAVKGVDAAGFKESLPVGTTFTFTIPAAADGTVPGVATQSTTDPSQVEIVAGQEGDSGTIEWTALLPDGVTSYSGSDTFDVIAGPVTGAVGVFGVPESV
jgi:hypothetical protein